MSSSSGLRSVSGLRSTTTNWDGPFLKTDHCNGAGVIVECRVLEVRAHSVFSREASVAARKAFDQADVLPSRYNALLVELLRSYPRMFDKRGGKAGKAREGTQPHVSHSDWRASRTRRRSGLPVQHSGQKGIRGAASDDTAAAGHFDRWQVRAALSRRNQPPLSFGPRSPHMHRDGCPVKPEFLESHAHLFPRTSHFEFWIDVAKPGAKELFVLSLLSLFCSLSSLLSLFSALSLLCSLLACLLAPSQ
jgi:hypothetical protein